MRLGLKLLAKNKLKKRNINEVLYKNKRIKVKIDFIYVLMKLFGMV
tara:strand:- start:534 stop:671 length:138 start_codon:yes stop_codon:yes gene_type:complete